MYNSLVKAVIDTGKPDTIEFQLLPWHHIQETDTITYDKMTGVQFRVESVSEDDWATCTIVGFDVYHLNLKYFQPLTTLFVMSRNVREQEFADEPTDNSITGRVEFP